MAHNTLEKLIKKATDFSNELKELSSARENKDYPKAYSVCLNLLESNYQSPIIWAVLGVLIQVMDDSEEAEVPSLEYAGKCFEVACKLSSERINPFIELGYFNYVANGDSKKALQQFEVSRRAAIDLALEAIEGELKCYVDTSNYEIPQDIIDFTNLFESLDCKLLIDELNDLKGDQ
ncbi:hypothetical protein [Spartinivicinus poritis]|uniref:Uncharacterized protein n=1 Tax=Spartinivicinus poritis TaxID=2994640 RepID=A0ABT5UGU7_9GAMM|nr:hypothetical protein [Spartinivicinus sp. A2-2]MDE1465578.1 hypothetical protein [Spartinivicinus sp. A2-2]